MLITILEKLGKDGGGAVDVIWSNLPPGTAFFKLYAEATGDPKNQNTDKTVHCGPQFKKASTLGGSTTIDGYHPGWELAFVGISLDKNNKELARSVRVVRKMKGVSSTEPWPKVVVQDVLPQTLVQSLTMIVDKSGKLSVTLR